MELFAAVPAAMGRSLPQILAESGRFGLTILVITFALSVMTWAVVWDRSRLYRKLRARGDALRRAIATRGVLSAMPDAERYLPAIEASILLEAQRFVAANGGEGSLAFDDPPRPTSSAPACAGSSRPGHSTRSARWNATSRCCPLLRRGRPSWVCSARCGASCTAS